MQGPLHIGKVLAIYMASGLIFNPAKVGMKIVTASQLNEIERRIEEINYFVDLLPNDDYRLEEIAKELSEYSNVLEYSYKRVRRFEIGLRLVNKIAC